MLTLIGRFKFGCVRRNQSNPDIEINVNNAST